MSKKTNVMVDVNDEVYDNLVQPLKKQKLFGRLIVSLLQGYYEVDAIRSYIDGAIDIEDSADNDELEASLQEMRRSLGVIDMHLEEAESIVDEGTTAFRDKAYHENTGEEYVTRADVESIISSSMDNLKDFLSAQLSGVVTQSTPVARKEEPKAELVEVAKSQTMTPVIKSSPLAEITEEEKEEGSNALSSLMEGMQITF